MFGRCCVVLSYVCVVSWMGRGRKERGREESGETAARCQPGEGSALEPAEWLYMCSPLEHSPCLHPPLLHDERGTAMTHQLFCDQRSL